MATGRFQGFSSEDVMYLIMPNRFANGDVANDDPAWKGLLDRRKGRYWGDGAVAESVVRQRGPSEREADVRRVGDHRLGDLALLKRMTAALQQKDIRMIQDQVANLELVLGPLGIERSSFCLAAPAAKPYEWARSRFRALP